MTQFLRDQVSDSEEVVTTAHAGRNLPVKEFCYLRTANLAAAVCATLREINDQILKTDSLK